MASESARAKITAQLSSDRIGDGLVARSLRLCSAVTCDSPSVRLLRDFVVQKQQSPLGGGAASGLEIRLRGLLRNSDRSSAPAVGGTTTRRTETGLEAAIHDGKSYMDMDVFAKGKIHSRFGEGCGAENIEKDNGDGLPPRSTDRKERQRMEQREYRGKAKNAEKATAGRRLDCASPGRWVAGCCVYLKSNSSNRSLMAGPFNGT